MKKGKNQIQELENNSLEDSSVLCEKFEQDISNENFKDENLKLFRLLKQTDDVQKRQEIRDEIVKKNRGMVNFVLKGYTNLLNAGSQCYPSYEDLQQEGVIGLIKAIDAFDEKKNKNFSTFACVCIKNEILMLNKRFSCESRPNGRNTYSLQNAICDECDIDGEYIYEEMVADTKQGNEFLDAKLDLNTIQTKFFKTLTLKQKQVFKLFYIDNIRVGEIAKKMDTNIQNVSHHIEKITRKARNFFKVSKIVNTEIHKPTVDRKNWSKLQALKLQKENSLSNVSKSNILESNISNLKSKEVHEKV